MSEWLVVDWLAGRLRFEHDQPLINQIGPLLDSECPSRAKVGPHASRGVSNINTSGSSVQAGFKLNHVWLAFDQMGKINTSGSSSKRRIGVGGIGCEAGKLMMTYDFRFETITDRRLFYMRKPKPVWCFTLAH